MIDVYYWPTPNGHKVTILLEEASIAYRVVPVNILAGEQFHKQFLDISPNNRIPAIVDHEPAGGGEPVPVFESGAILLYLSRKTGAFWPTTPAAEAKMLEWLMWQMSALGPMAGQCHHFYRYAPEKLPYAINRYLNETARLYSLMDRQLGDRQYIAGDSYGLADMACHPWVKFHEMHGQNLDDFPNVSRWYDEIAARAAVVRAYELGEKYSGGEVDEEARKILFNQTAESTRAID